MPTPETPQGPRGAEVIGSTGAIGPVREARHAGRGGAGATRAPQAREGGDGERAEAIGWREPAEAPDWREPAEAIEQATPAAPGAKARRARRRGVLYWCALAWLALVALAAAAADWLPVADPNAINIPSRVAGPGTEGFILGADGLGRDILARLVHGARVSLVISLAAVTIGMVVGGVLGMAVGYFRGRLETVVMAIVDVLLAFPGLVLLLGLVAFVGQSLLAITIVVGFLSIPVYTRVARATTLAVSQREFVLAAKAMGATHGRIIFREIMPNVVMPVMAFGLVALGVIIVLEGSLAFLGLSVEAPQATWGSMIAEGKRHLHATVHVALFPSIAMFLTVLSLNFVGDTLRRRFDVRESAL